MHPGPSIRRIRQRKKLTLEQLAERVERFLGRPVNTGNLSRLEREGQGYSNDLLQAVARALDTPPGELFAPPPLVHEEGVRVNPAVSPVANITYSIPLLEVEAGMGGGRVQPEYETIVGKIDVNREWVRAHLPNISGPNNLRVIAGRGDSMAGTFEDGDVLFIDVGYNEVRLDAVYAFELGDELFIKRLQRQPDGSLTVLSDNKRYEPYRLPAGRDGFRVIGRVVGAWNWRKL